MVKGIGIPTGAAIEDVVARTTCDKVIATATVDSVIARTTCDIVNAAATCDSVYARTAIEGTAIISACNGVVARPTSNCDTPRIGKRSEFVVAFPSLISVPGL